MDPMVFDGYGFGFFAILSAVTSLVFFVLVIVLVVLGIRWLLRQDRAASGPRAGSGPPGEDPALALLLGALRARRDRRGRVRGTPAPARVLSERLSRVVSRAWRPTRYAAALPPESALVGLEDCGSV